MTARTTKPKPSSKKSKVEVRARFRQLVLDWIYIQTRLRAGLSISQLAEEAPTSYGIRVKPVVNGFRCVQLMVEPPMRFAVSTMERESRKLEIFRVVNQHLFVSTAKKATKSMHQFFIPRGMLEKQGRTRYTFKDKNWHDNRDIVLAAIVFLYREVLGKDPSEKPPKKGDFKGIGMRDMLKKVFNDDPREAVIAAGLMKPEFEEVDE